MRTVILAFGGVGLFVAALMIVADWFGPYPTAGRTKRMKTVELIVSGHHFQVPGARRRRWRMYWLGGEVDAITMDGVLPDLAPFSDENEHIYETVEGRTQIALFGIWHINRGIGVLEPYFGPGYGKNCSGEWRGHRICPALFGDDQTVAYVKQEGRKKIAIECDKEGSVPEPHCDMSLPLLPNTKLTIYFHRHYLDTYKHIIKRTYEIVCGYYDYDRDRPLSYSYCDNGVYHGPTSND